MSWETILLTALTTLGSTFTLIYLQEGSQKEIDNRNDGGIELRMNKLYQIFGYIIIALALIVVIVALYLQEKKCL